MALAVASALALSLSACASTPGGESTPGGPTTEPGAVDQELVALLPEDVRDRGSLIIGASLDYPPDNFMEDDGTTPTGYMVDILQAVGDRVGLEIDYQRVDFASVLTGIEAGRYDGGISFLDSRERQEVVNVVGVYGAAQSFLVMDGNEIDIPPCGLKVGVGAGSIEETYLGRMSDDECVAEGLDPIQILTSPSNPQAQTAMASGRVDAVFGSTAAAAWAVEESDGAFAIAGEPFKLTDSPLTGIAVNKDRTDIAEALQAIVQSLIDDGTYDQILDEWGVAGIAVDTATLNGATE
ncbi:ABC transporter substrate-binding protein [Microbacterium sp. SSM24]|uniref:ABC transporter substrate-binding protein n=1 Tax=Microbacterium sp. SSM24 TaxID=2991714 RepID=UPI0022273F8A|nr:ABC transporter substrate-binding protein [Microbacterium sp. SSM24]MCW3493358.1 ABC transporter substrate-binding protein [Microbacterium sp. SSM24]